MKYLAIYITILLFACSNNKSAEEKKLASNASSDNKKEVTTSSTSSKDDIVGEWELAGVTEDKNGNGQLDQEERDKASNMKDYMKLNSDGTSEFYTFKMKGRYEITTNPDSGKKYLDLIDKTNTRHKKGYIMSITKDELLIMNKFGGDAITIWKRL